MMNVWIKEIQVTSKTKVKKISEWRDEQEEKNHTKTDMWRKDNWAYLRNILTQDGVINAEIINHIKKGNRIHMLAEIRTCQQIYKNCSDHTIYMHQNVMGTSTALRLISRAVGIIWSSLFVKNFQDFIQKLPSLSLSLDNIFSDPKFILTVQLMVEIYLTTTYFAFRDQF